jgi:CHAT domain-containing protein
MVRLMSGAAGEQYRNPAYWAPFVLIGDDGVLGKIGAGDKK